MSTATLTRPAVGLMPPGWDLRPCVNKPAQWWDLGDDHNSRAIRYCRNVCPDLQQCAATIPTDKDRPKAQIRAGRAFNELGQRVTICGNCDHPRLRIGQDRAIRCRCPRKPSREELRAQRRAEREAKEAARLAALAAQPPRGQALIDAWVPLHCAGYNIRESAERIGVSRHVLKNALHRARARGDRRVPFFRAARKPQAVTA